MYYPDRMRWYEPRLSHEGGPPTIKNHTVTYFDGLLYCFGGYDGRKNHGSLLVYSIEQRRWYTVETLDDDGDTEARSATGGALSIDHLALPHQQRIPWSALPGHDIPGNNSNRGTRVYLPPSPSYASPFVPHRTSPNSITPNSSVFLGGLQSIGGGDSGNIGAVHSNISNNRTNNISSFIISDRSSLPSTFKVSGFTPPGRNGHTATLVTRRRNPTGGNHTESSSIYNTNMAHVKEDVLIFIIGGWLGVGPLASADMYILDITNLFEFRWIPVERTLGTPPGPCNMHSADFVADQREIYVFRGGNGREYLNDLHAFHVDTFTWRTVETYGAVPQQRANHSSAILEETNEFFIFGGWNGKERLNDIHILDISTSTWSKPSLGGLLPHPRAGMTLTALSGRLYLFGGSGTSSKCFQDLQILDRKEMAWLDVTQLESPPNITASPSLNALPSGGNVSAGGGTSNAANIPGGTNSTNVNRRRTMHSPMRRSRGESIDALIPVGENNGAYISNSNIAEDEDLFLSPSSSSFEENWGQIGIHNAGKLVGGGFQRIFQRQESYGRAFGEPSFAAMSGNSVNPNDEEDVPTIYVHGKGPGRRAGHSATAVNRKIFVFGGSCGSDYLHDFFVLDTDPSPRVTVSEPNSLELLQKRLPYFVNEAEFSDVTFLVEGRRICGHRMILSLVSDCFRAMFTTGFRESSMGCAEIEIPYCSYESFVTMLEYIYSGHAPNLSVDSELGKVVDLLSLADRFILDHLKQLCEKMLIPAIDTYHLDYLVQVAQKCNAKQLEAACHHFERNRGFSSE